MKKERQISSAENFGQQLKAWRKEKGLSQRELSDLLGVSKAAVYNYEHGKNRISPNIAKKLVALGFEQVFLAEGRVRTSYDEPLTNKERQFAENHHDMVYRFLTKKGLPYDDWYDVIIFGYLKAVKKWFARQDLHIYAFSTIAYWTMNAAVLNERAKQKRRPEYKAVSLDDIIPGTDGITYMDMLSDPRDCVGI